MPVNPQARRRRGTAARDARRDARRDAQLDRAFKALADPTRRRMLERLAQGPAMVSELAAPFDVSLPAISRHLKVLEAAGFVTRHVDGRVHTCVLDPGPMQAVDEWTRTCRQFWTETLDALARHAAERAR
jgi:DNA-binding transcriptional ArsR family regulator